MSTIIFSKKKIICTRLSSSIILRFKYICIICPSVGSQTCFVDKLCVFASTIQVIRPRVKNSPNAPSFGKVGHQYLHLGIHHSGNELNFEYLDIFRFPNILKQYFYPTDQSIEIKIIIIIAMVTREMQKAMNQFVLFSQICAWPKRHFTVFLVVVAF